MRQSDVDGLHRNVNLWIVVSFPSRCSRCVDEIKIIDSCRPIRGWIKANLCLLLPFEHVSVCYEEDSIELVAFVILCSEVAPQEEPSCLVLNSVIWPRKPNGNDAVKKEWWYQCHGLALFQSVPRRLTPCRSAASGALHATAPAVRAPAARRLQRLVSRLVSPLMAMSHQVREESSEGYVLNGG